MEPAALADRKAVVFISHEHHDHFWPGAVGWLERVPDLLFVVSPEVARADGPSLRPYSDSDSGWDSRG